MPTIILSLERLPFHQLFGLCCHPIAAVAECALLELEVRQAEREAKLRRLGAFEDWTAWQATRRS